MIPQKENPRIPHNMGHGTKAGRGGRSGNSGQGGVAKEVVAEVPVQWCLERHQRLVPARI